MPEVQTMVDSKQVKTLAIMRPDRDPAYPSVPTIKEALGVEWNLGAWRGIAGPAGLPPEVASRLDAALRKVVNDPEFQKLMASRKFGVQYADSKGFQDFLAKADRDFGDAAKAAGLAK
jgi:tripartite-type tricarboxylate transporter receptor subunit TctC